ncbi:MAG: carboxypeptidase regulatory-like domain-containing protein [Myxococcales bacterium]|nr:carboxypeptidase regulatory-like domain-containing protein [Myxococcales bacterium]
MARPLDVGLHLNETEILLEVARAHAIEGRVVSSSGTLPPGLSITGGPIEVAVDAKGNFKIEGVGPGTYRLVPKVGAKNTLFSSAAVEVVAADVAGVELQLEPTSGIEIIASRQDGAPVPGLRFTCTQEHDGSLKSCECTTGDDGPCRVEGLVAGRIEHLRPKLSGFAERTIAVPWNKPVHFEVPDLGGISGEVVSLEGDPIPWRIITAQGEDGKPIGPVISDAKGRFQLGGLMAGAYDVQVYSYDNRSFSAYFVDRKKKPIGQTAVTLGQGELAKGIRIQAAYAEGKITGRVVGDDGQPQPSALVTYVIDSPRVQYRSLPVGVEMAVAENDGSFSFNRVNAAHTYRVFAQGVTGEQGTLASVSADGKPLSIAVKMPAELRVAVTGLLKIKEIARVTVKNQQGGEESKVLFPTPDNLGQSGCVIRFPGIDPGEWEMTVSQGNNQASATVTIRPAQVETIAVRIQ